MQQKTKSIYSFKFLLFYLIIAVSLSIAYAKEKSNRMKDIQLHPEFPVAEGLYKITKEWSVALPGKFSKRFEDVSLVFWRPGFTIWTKAWNNDKNESKEIRLKNIIKDASPERYNELHINNDILLYSYRLRENEGDKRVASFYCYAVGKSGIIQMAIYFDKEEDLKWAIQIWKSLQEV